MGSGDWLRKKSSGVPEDCSSGHSGASGPGGGGARLIIWERSGIWASALYRACPKLSPYWRRVRNGSAAWRAFEARRGSFLVVELWPDTLPQILNVLRWIERFAPESRLAVVTHPQWAELEWMFRQAGLVHFISSPRQVGPLAQLALRHLKRVAQRRGSLAERIWRRLPFGSA